MSAANRPKIGIRPTIDGRRRGVRESLEDQTMNMAKSAADLISANLRYPNGEPVECVIADTCIGGVAEAAACAEKFAAKAWASRSPSRPAGATAPRRWTWTRSCPRPSGASTAPSAPARSTWRPCWPPTTRRACRPSASTAATCRTPATPDDPRRRAGEAAALCPRRAGRGHDARQVVPVAGRRLDGHRRLDRRPDFFESYLGMRVRSVDMTEFVRRIERRHLTTPAEYQRPGLGEEELQGRQGPQPAEASSSSREQKDKTGRPSSRWP
jgi:L-fucose/D-arabinose isomerase